MPLRRVVQGLEALAFARLAPRTGNPISLIRYGLRHAIVPAWHGARPEEKALGTASSVRLAAR